jgi:hypothetical protein
LLIQYDADVARTRQGKMMTAAAQDRIQRRTFMMTALAGAGTALSVPARASSCRASFNRVAYERYVSLMNACDIRFAAYYADDIKFEMNITDKAGVLNFYADQWAFMKETLEIVSFCSDATGAAAEVRSELRCIKDYDGTAIFGRALKAGEVQIVRGYIFYTLNAQGLITQIKGPPPEVLQPWRFVAA